MRLQTETRKLPTELSPEDLAKESQKLAAAVEEVGKQEDAIAEKTGLWRETKKKMDGYLAHLKDEMNALATIVDTGMADRDVTCSWLYALKQGYAFLVRDDNGELVTHRKLGEQERQTEILEVIREPTEEQFAAWSESLGLVPDPQGDLPLSSAGEPVYYYRDFTLTGEHGQERITARFSEADHRPASLNGVHLHEETGNRPGLPEQINRAALDYDSFSDTLRTYRQALEDLLEAKKADAVAKNRAGGDPTVAERVRIVPDGSLAAGGRGRKAKP